MEPHLYLKRGKKNILLVRYFDKFHFITLDHRMHHQARKWLLACPRTEEEMDRWHISRSTIAVKYVRGVAAGGTGRGHVVQFYLTEGKRRYELKEDCDLSHMSALFVGLDSFDPPKQDSKWQDPRFAKQDPTLRNYLWLLGWMLNLFACAGALMVWAAGFEIKWVCWMTMLCIPLSILLYCLFPDYFTIFGEIRKYGKKKGALGLWGPLVCPVGMILGAISCYHIFDWWKAWIIGAAAVVILAVALYLTAPVFRAWDKVGMLVLVGLLISGGPVLALNHLLDSSPVREIHTEVADKDEHHSTKGGNHYNVTVVLDGEEMEFPVFRDFYSETEIGEIVTVEFHKGAFDIGYAVIEQ